MGFYKAREQVTPPYLVFDHIAESDEELQAYLDKNNGGNPDPLIVDENLFIDDQDPDYISFEFGICHKRIFNNTLIDRDQVEIDEQQSTQSASVEIKKASDLEQKISLGTFIFGANEFPMTSASRELYNAIFNTTAADHNILSTSGEVTLSAADIPTFKAAFYAKILTYKTEY